MSSAEELANTKQELADVLELLTDSPDDEELLTLKSDLEELIALAEDEDEAEAEPTTSAPAPDPPTMALQVEEKTYDRSAAAFLTGNSVSPAGNDASDLLNDLEDSTPAPSETKKPKSKIKVDTEFSIPQNLRLLPTDTEETKLKKRKKVKALKSKFKNIKSEVVATSKAASWQNFKSGGSKKKKRKGLKQESMFKTGEGSGVGVSSLDVLNSREEGGEVNPKRFKY
ncbi:hypothetical protein TrLO_g10516 [Triparma laevis f. longispina]|uniref:Uncharacterized protein n=1 Tax=Triparma laevis f. longispina TaxID=1714387 RepID=A0A9W7KXF2_9STRA|nr:hypothetical protein TrLO_g10516 [Triparma laevis f. longispina]